MNQLKINKNKSYFLIFNPVSGNLNSRTIDRVLSIYRNSGYKYDYILTKRKGEALELARKAVKEGYQIIVAAGGDGTVNEVVCGIYNSEAVLGIIPLGSGNGFARNLKIPLNPGKAVRVLLNGKEIFCDLCLAGDRPYICTGGTGFDSLIARGMVFLKRRGLMEYIKLVIREYFKYHPIQIKLVLENKTIEKKAFLVSFANARQFGNNAIIAPDAKINDGLIDIVIIDPFKKFLAPLVGLSLFTGKLNRFKFYNSYQVKKATIEKASVNWFHIDGEFLEIEFPYTVSLKGNGLKVLVPQ